jgi:glucose-6-phosphate 1-dehydrogenase
MTSTVDPPVSSAESLGEEIWNGQPNPLLAGLPAEVAPKPVVVVIFGGTGDLARRKLLPALYNLAARHNLPQSFAVVGIGRHIGSATDYKDEVAGALREFAAEGPAGVSTHQRLLDSFLDLVNFCHADFRDPNAYRDLKQQLERLHRKLGTDGNTLYYLATPPEFDAVIVENLSAAGLILPPVTDGPSTRVIFEKPFGSDFADAVALNREIHKFLSEDQIFRIDHYLGKETVQNIMAVRFANGILEPLWNRNYVDNIQITAAESVGIENRIAYYEHAGALKDMIQSHLLQVFSLVAMEPPVSWSGKAIHDEKVKVLQAIERITGDRVDLDAVRGQYGPGWISGAEVPGYRREPGVPSDSATDTYAALRLSVDSWRWAGVPIYLRTGKRLPRRATEITLTFKRPPQMLFQSAGSVQEDLLTMRIQPDEGVTLTLNSKVPGQGFQIQPVHLDFLYGATFADAVPEAYERLLLDAMRGESTLFTRTDEVEESWSVVQDIIDRWSDSTPDFPNYAAGTWGPEAAECLLRARQDQWRNP